MITSKSISIKGIYSFAGHHLYWLTAWMTLVTSIYYFTGSQMLTMPTLPLTLIGTAVAFYVGFKNNQSYDRLWEARKIWGSIINNSRMLGTMTKNMTNHNQIDGSIIEIRRNIIYRHIAYLYQLRNQLLQPTQWEHVSLGLGFGAFNRKRRDQMMASFDKEIKDVESRSYLSSEDQSFLVGMTNKATQILDLQSQDIQSLYTSDTINMMQQVALQNVVNSFYDDQGKAERIKKFPLPRQYSAFSFIFVSIFVFLLPFGLLAPVSELGKHMVWMAIPAGVIVGWIYVVMEMIGDYSENPFEGLHNDIPMLNICRTIEIDLLQMIGEKDIPKPIEPKNNVLI